MRRNDDFHQAAFYVSRRARSEWVEDDATTLVGRFTFLAERPRMVFAWGTWRARPRRRTSAGDRRNKEPAV